MLGYAGRSSHGLRLDIRRKMAESTGKHLNRGRGSMGYMSASYVLAVAVRALPTGGIPRSSCDWQHCYTLTGGFLLGN